MNAILPPLVVDVRIRETEARGYRIWIPMVVLWPLLFVLVGFALLVAAIVDLVLLLAGARYHHYSLLLIRSMRVLNETRGLRTRIDSQGHRVDIDIL